MHSKVTSCGASIRKAVRNSDSEKPEAQGHEQQQPAGQAPHCHPCAGEREGETKVSARDPYMDEAQQARFELGMPVAPS